MSRVKMMMLSHCIHCFRVKKNKLFFCFVVTRWQCSMSQNQYSLLCCLSLHHNNYVMYEVKELKSSCMKYFACVSIKLLCIVR